MASVSSVSNTNLSTEARINFGKLSETPERAISLQIYTFQDTSRQSTLKKATLPLVEVSFQSLPSALMLIRYSSFPLFSPLKNKFCCTTHFKTELNPCSMEFGLFSRNLVLSFMKMFSRINCFSRARLFKPVLN